MKVRVMWFIDGLGQGGAEHLLPVILKHVDSEHFEHRVCVFSVRDGNPNADLIRQAGIPVDLLPIPNLRQPANLPRLVRYLRLHRPDIVHTQLEFANTLGTLAAAWLRIPSVCTLHVMEAIDKRSREYWRHRLMWFTLKTFSKRILAVSNGAREFFIRTERVGQNQIQTLYNGIELDRFQVPPSAAQEVRAGLGILPGERVLTTVAYVREPKGIQHMLAALPAVLAVHPHCRYLIVGDGDYLPALRQQAADLGLSDRVIFTGKRADIPALLATGELFVLPSLNDALPTVLMEAMAVARPIVATRVGGIPEMVVDGQNGRLVAAGSARDLADACINLLDHPDRSARMGADGLQMVTTRFNIETQCDLLEEIYTQILAGR